MSYIETTPIDNRDPSVTDFWSSVNQLPPPGVSALCDDETPVPQHKTWDLPLVQCIAEYDRQQSMSAACLDKGNSAAVAEEIMEFTCDAAILRRDRRPRAVLSEGQAVFWRYSTDMFDALGHFSLAGGRRGMMLRLNRIIDAASQGSHPHASCQFCTRLATSPARQRMPCTAG